MNYHGASHPSINHSSMPTKQPSTFEDNVINNSVKSALKEEAETNADTASDLLAAILVLYKDTMINSPSVLHPPLPLRIFRDYLDTHPSYAEQQVSQGVTDLEKKSAKVAKSWISSQEAFLPVNLLFYAIINLTRPGSSFTESIEFNAKAVFNVVIASIAQGSQARDCVQLLVLCMHLKDTKDCYPLRTLASMVCLDIICAMSLPIHARTSALRLVLGPADFVLYHLETRIRLSEIISHLFEEDCYEDIEFRTIVVRLARKFRLTSPSSALEQVKIRLYHYLELVVADPIQYCQEQRMFAYLPKAQWNDALNQDLIFYLFITEYRPQMLLFLEALRAAGIVTVMFEPTPIQSAILGEQRFDSYSMTLLHSLYLQLSKVFNDARQTSLPNMSDTTNDQIHNLAVIVTLKQLEPTSSIKLGLSKSSSIVSRAIEHTEKHVLSDNISQLLNFVKRLLQVSSVAPIQFMSRILWMTAVSMGALSLLREHCQSIGPKSQVYEATALCLDIFLCTLLHRDGPRCSSILPPDIEDSNFENFKQDVNLALFLFATLLPADDPSTWRCCLVFNDDGSAEFGSKNGHPEPNLLADFLLQLFEYLISILEKLVHQQHQHQQQSEFSFTAILAGVLFEILSLQIPTTILMQEPIRIIKVLDDILDLQNNSTLVTLPAWHKLFSSNDCPHFLSTLLARINTLQRFF